MPKINAAHAKNFATLNKAAKYGDLALLDAKRVKDGKTVALVVAMQHEKNGEVTFVPLAVMIEGNPYEDFLPQDPNGDGYAEPDAASTQSKGD